MLELITQSYLIIMLELITEDLL